MADKLIPTWSEEMKSHYLAGGSSFFIFHGNVDDLVGTDQEGAYVVETLPDYLAGRLLKTYDLVLHYDVGRGLRSNAGGDPQRLTRMNSLLSQILGATGELPRESSPVLRLIDRLVTLLLVGSASGRNYTTAFLFDYGEMICPPDDYHHETLALLLNWARSPVIRRVNMIFMMMTGSLAQLHPALVQSAYTTEIRIPMPSQAQRREFIFRSFPGVTAHAERLATLSAGLTLSNLDQLLRLAAPQAIDQDRNKASVGIPAGGPVQDQTRPAPGPPQKVLDQAVRPQPVAPPVPFREELLTQIKKQLIEAQCPGLIEFVEPRLNLDMIAGHEAARRRLSDDARLIREGFLDAVPMGYLICGPVGVGKTFLALCYAGTVGIPCVTIRNFRSKYVGETEANLEKILNVLRELGPVAVIIDEADAAVGDREASGDSGTSARVFAQIASQMGDTRYRGRIIWFMLTCRPDLLPIDLKRQGRCEEHIPLFYPETSAEVRDMFLAMAKKLKVDLPGEAIPEVDPAHPLSGADIEALITRVRRTSLLTGRQVDRDMLTSALQSFRSSRGPEHELQILAAVLECTDLAYFPASIRKIIDTQGGWEAVQRKFMELSRKD